MASRCRIQSVVTDSSSRQTMQCNSSLFSNWYISNLSQDVCPYGNDWVNRSNNDEKIESF
ncbi:hypothetical protein FD720_13660 [Photobacterium damselae subsp. damselae]|nr:hypothetical protein FD721_17925 [Photobacterium damselae subsp. damselae]TLS80590.1 hypothetical protein FD719_17925 [Photobacterium damselae subsp. damselae]TLS85964.1 hypothetical protein FD720_13660 [Photobacterium damselae subsp. damselae]TLS86977.1 hypothetical protein FD722_18045 [Photobacterium damselae subsp. damselae]